MAHYKQLNHLLLAFSMSLHFEINAEIQAFLLPKGKNNNVAVSISLQEFSITETYFHELTKQ